jgi:carbamoyl-phosphate synthase large subunit
MVPGAAGPAGINTIKSLRMGGYSGSIIATDSSRLASGFYLASKHYILPQVSQEQEYAEKLLSVVSDENVQIMMPSSGYDIYAYSKLKNQLEKRGARPVVSSRHSLEICRDKLLTYQSLVHKFGHEVLPFTTSDPNKISQFPIIAKPRFGKGSKNVVKIDNETDLQYVMSKFDDEDMIFQEFLPGEEYSVDVLSNLSEKPLLAVPRLRLQTKAGISTQGKIQRNAELESLCMNIAKSVGIVGPSCIQMKRSTLDRGAGRLFKLIEINARMGGGTIFTTLAGANFPKIILDMVEGKEIVIPKISEIMVIRYYQEIVINDSGFDIMNKAQVTNKASIAD